MVGTTIGISGWEKALLASERVKERLRRATRALEDAAVPYAVVGGNAVAEWVARVDEGAVRNTKDVDILVRRDDLPAVKAALEAVGFEYHRIWGVDTFIDGAKVGPAKASTSCTMAKWSSPATVTRSPMSTIRNGASISKWSSLKRSCG